MPTTKELAQEAASLADQEEREAAEAKATAEREAQEARLARSAAKAAAEVAARDVHESPEAKKDREAKLKNAKMKEPAAEGSAKKFYRTCLGYPLYHPWQNKLVPVADGSPAAELEEDGWVKIQLEAGYITVVDAEK